MRRFALAAVLALGALACSDSTGPDNDVSVFFQIDQQTCVSGSATFQFFIDGASVGSETLSAGGKSRAYKTSAAQHTLGALIANTTVQWGPLNVDLTGHSSWTQVLQC